MSGGHLEKFKKLFRLNLVLILVLNGVSILALSYFLLELSDLNDQLILAAIAVAIVIVSIIAGFWMTSVLTKPTEFIAQAIFHISPNQHLVAAPDPEKLTFGKELVVSLTRQMYDLASTHSALAEAERSSNPGTLLDSLPICIIGLDAKNHIVLVNQKTKQMFGVEKLSDQSLEELVNIKYTEQSLDDWKNSSKDTAIKTTKSWTSLEVTNNAAGTKNYFDVAASYSQKNLNGIEIILILFPKEKQYQAEESAVNLLSMSVHEIRTPLTILRGYIEVLRQELSNKVDPDTQAYIDRISTSSENLASYMANVLNVAKAEQSQLNLDLRPADWSKQLTESAQALSLRAKVRGKQIQLKIAQNLPEVAIDSLSINEVVTNLVENSIKYSPLEATNIYIEASLDTDGSVLTTVRDEGVGIPDSVIKNLFTKFYRDHRNKNQVAGTGLGLYISKEIVSAHHGNIWIKSKEGQGTTVGFTLVPASKLDEISKNDDNGFEKVGRGWIKNHNMQRR